MPLQDILSSIHESKEDEALLSLEIDAPELDTMRTLADAADYQGIHELCEVLASRNVFDIRILIYSLYADYQRKGLLGLDEALSYLVEILGPCWENIGPTDRRDKYAKNSFAWLLKQILIDLQTVQLEQGDIWGGLLEVGSRDHVARMIERAEDVKEPLNHRLGDTATPIFIPLKELIEWLKEFMLLFPMPEAEQAAGEDYAASIASTENVAVGHQVPPATFAPILSGSVHLQILNRKLALFEEVLHQGDLVKAAVIAMDVNQLLESFDPKKYFPDLFSNYFSNMVDHSDEINDIIEMSGSPKWQALVNLYEVDLDKFKDIRI